MKAAPFIGAHGASIPVDDKKPQRDIPLFGGLRFRALKQTLAIASNPSERECYPCGQCRQVMVDVERRQGSPMRVIMSGNGSASVVPTATALLPFTFIL